jgi:hypothetical protein
LTDHEGNEIAAMLAGYVLRRGDGGRYGIKSLLYGTSIIQRFDREVIGPMYRRLYEQMTRANLIPGWGYKVYPGGRVEIIRPEQIYLDPGAETLDTPRMSYLPCWWVGVDVEPKPVPPTRIKGASALCTTMQQFLTPERRPR